MIVSVCVRARVCVVFTESKEYKEENDTHNL